MLRSELILKLHNKYTSLKLSDIENIVDLFLKKIFLGLHNNQNIEIRKFGTFSKKINKENMLGIQKQTKKFLKLQVIKFILR